MLALGSAFTLAAMIFGAAVTMKVQLLDAVGFPQVLGHALADMQLLPAPNKPKTV